MINPTIIDERINAARARDNAVTDKLLKEVSRLPVIAPWQDGLRSFSRDILNQQLKPGRYTDSGISPDAFQQLPENGSYAYQLYSAICFVVDARAELKLLELIASPDFYASLMRSAAEVKP